MLVFNDQGGGRMDITEDITQTLRAEDHGHPPIILVLLQLIADCKQLKETEDDLLCREEIL